MNSVKRMRPLFRGAGATKTPRLRMARSGSGHLLRPHIFFQLVFNSSSDLISFTGLPFQNSARFSMVVKDRARIRSM
jgi:hypothetical protein